jgi:PAS domain S-box-containing protein
MTEDAARISLAGSTLGDTRELQRSDVDASRTFSADNVTQLGNCLKDLGNILAVPAVRAGAEPSQIVSTLVDALIGMLRLSFVYVRLSDPEGRPSTEMMRVADSVGGTDGAREIHEAIDSSLGNAPRKPLSHAAVSVGEVDLSVASSRLGLGGEIGIVVAGSQRPDFPTQTERLLLDVAANQATIGLQQACLTEERRVVEELNERVAQRTRELGIANEALRETEHDSRLLLDSIPGLVALLTVAGEVQFVNRHILEYTGRTLDELKQWGTSDTVHPEDLPHVIRVFTESIGSGSRYEIVQRLRRSDGAYRWFQNNGFPLRDTSGHIVRWCVLLTDIDERKRAEDALRESERESRLIVDSIPGFIAAFTPAGELEFVNRPIVDYFGKTFEELKHWGTGGATHPEDLPRIVELFTRSIASGEPFAFEVRARRFDGVYRWFQSRGFPLREPNGQIVRWYNLLIDIDERKHAEEELRLSEARKTAILDSAIDCIVTIDHEGCITEFNPAAERTFGYRRDEVLGQQLADVIIPPALRGRHREGFARYLATGEAHVLGRRIEMTAVHADGREFPIELAITRIPSDGPPSFTGYLRDITERKHSEEELRRSEAFLAEAQHLSRVGSFSWRVATDEIMWSEQLYRIFEIDRDVRVTFEVIGTRVHPEDLSVFKEQIERSRRDGSNVQLEIRLQMPDRTVKYVHVVAHCRAHDDQLEYIGAVQDVTQRRLADAALAKLRSELASVARVTSLGVLTASIAHEVNQPLAGIITNAGTCLRMLGADPPDVSGARETARRTIRDGNRASEVIARLRALFTKKESTTELVDLNEATREVIALSLSDLHRNRVILHLELADDLPSITGDRVQLQQVILNLVRNASDAMAGVDDRPRQLLIRTEREGADRARVTVRDAGVGIAPQGIDKLFDAFYTTKSDGMGIGLSVSRSIIERHHGRLWAEPNEGPGATFSFSIPFQTA